MTAPDETLPPAPPAERPAEPQATRAGASRRSRGALARGGLAVLFWGLMQGLVAVPPAFVGAALGVLVGAGFLWWYVVRRDYPGEMSRRATLRLRPPGPVLAWVPAVLVCAIGFAAASLVLAARVLPLPKSDAFEYFERMRHGWVPFTVLAVGLAPMMEEFLFRGWMQRNLERRLPPARAILVTALVFAAAHFDLFGFSSRFVVGVAAGYLALLSRSIVPSTMLHAAYNGSLLLADELPGELSDRTLVQWASSPGVLLGAALLAVVSALALAWVLRRAALHARVARRSRLAPGRSVAAVGATSLGEA